MPLPQPYVGVTGFMPDDVPTAQACIAVVHELAPSHRFMAGVLVSATTLRAAPTASRRYPSIRDVDTLLTRCAEAGAWPVVHYNTRATGDDFAAELRVLKNLCPSMRGLQLNIVCPDRAVVREFAYAHENVEVILQINQASLDAIRRPPALYGFPWDYVERYAGIRHALLDASAGTGKAFDADRTGERIMECYDQWDRYMIRGGVAGGLGPDCGPMLDDLRDAMLGQEGDPDIELRELSFDMESNVRVPVDNPTPGAKHQDRLDHDKAVAGVRAVCKAIRGGT